MAFDRQLHYVPNAYSLNGKYFTGLFHGEVAYGRSGASSWLRHAAADAKNDDMGRGGGRGGSRTHTAVDAGRNE